MDPLTRGGESCKKSRFGRKVSYLISDTPFELSRGQVNGAIHSTDGCKVVNVSGKVGGAIACT